MIEKGAKTILPSAAARTCATSPASMRKLAWRLGWLDRSVDPPDGLEIGKANFVHGATAQYVDPRLRPETRQVKAMADAVDKPCGPDGTDPLLTRLPLFGTKIRIAGFGGLRLGEQNALRAIDVFFEHGYVHVNGSWITPRGAAGFRGPVKNHTLHEVPLPNSLLRDELLPCVKELLGLLPRHRSSRSSTPKRRSANAVRQWRRRPRTAASRGGTTRLHPRTNSGFSSTRRPACAARRPVLVWQVGEWISGHGERPAWSGSHRARPG